MDTFTYQNIHRRETLSPKKTDDGIRKNISTCLFSFHNITSLSSKEQVDKKTSMFNKANPSGLIFPGM